jgi:glycerophosphoryl diester phosphodiesterase
MTRPAIAALIFFIFGLLIVSGWWQPHAPDVPDRQPLLTQRPNLNLQLGAHRAGSPYAPENTLPAIEAAIERGAAWVELDVRYTSDGVPVLFHDEDVSRTTNATGLLEDYSLEDLQVLDAGSWFAADYAGTTVPTLEQALALMQGRTCAYWDAKALPTRRAVELFQRYGFKRGCLVIRTYDEWSNILHLLWPDAPLIRGVAEPLGLAEMVADHPWLAAIRVAPQRLDEAMVDAAHVLGLSVFVRVKESGEEARIYINHAAVSGADVIALADLEAFIAWQAARQESGEVQSGAAAQSEELARP